MKKLNIATLISASLLLTGCAQTTGWTPTIDTYNDPNAYRINQDMAECEQLASQAASSVKETATGAVAGGLIGAAGGAAIGAMTGSAGTGAAIGAAAGGLGGASTQGIRSDDQYKNAYRSCMRQRGHTVVN